MAVIGQAPGELAKLQAFVNTLDIEQSTDELSTPAALDQWLQAAGLAGPDAGGQVSPPSEPADLAAAIELREALRAVLLAHAPHPPAEPTGPATTNASSADTGTADTGTTDTGTTGTRATTLAAARTRLAGAAAAAQARIVVRADGSVGLAAAGTGSPQALAALLLIAAEAATTGSWTRLKACAADDCHWAFYDRSPTRNGCWCSMQICGSRAKSRAYRSRAAVLTGSGRARRARTRR
jgi:predicted RNA-binding Zn ribbon-like protein